MNLLEVRQQFRTLSGRFDLVGSLGEDQGANFFLNSGMKWLDRKIIHKKSAGRFFKVVSAGDYFATFKYCQSIKEVWMGTTTTRTQLTKKTIEDFRISYPEPWNLIDEDTPLYYTPAYLRAVPETNMLGMDSMIGYADVMIGANYEYNGILFAPKADQQMTLEVWGYFYTIPMSADTDENYWTVNHPDILIAAGLRQVEIFNRNSQGRLDWESTINEMLMDIDRDIVEEEISEIDQMEG
jgi:hypothetical protein